MKKLLDHILQHFPMSSKKGREGGMKSDRQGYDERVKAYRREGTKKYRNYSEYEWRRREGVKVKRGGGGKPTV